MTEADGIDSKCLALVVLRDHCGGQDKGLEVIESDAVAETCSAEKRQKPCSGASHIEDRCEMRERV